jgi:hypothetical protein
MCGTKKSLESEVIWPLELTRGIFYRSAVLTTGNAVTCDERTRDGRREPMKSMNEATRARVRDAILADPAQSNRTIAAALHVSRHTVNDVRHAMNSEAPMHAVIELENAGSTDAAVVLPVVPASLDVLHARLPAAYESAVIALTKATEIDECHDWANKAEALASYARQAKDERLHRMAKRIQARAIRRCGELLAKVKPAQGANQNIRDGGDPKVTRSNAASAAGMSERQRKNALRVAAVPARDFEQQVESVTPPTITALAAQGKNHVAPARAKASPAPTIGGPKVGVERVCGEVARFAAFCEKNRCVGEAVALMSHPIRVRELRQRVGVIDAWLDQIVVNLPDGHA